MSDEIPVFTYRVTKLDGTTIDHANISGLEVTDRTISLLDDQKEVSAVYAVASIIGIQKVVEA